MKNNIYILSIDVALQPRLREKPLSQITVSDLRYDLKPSFAFADLFAIFHGSKVNVIKSKFAKISCGVQTRQGLMSILDEIDENQKLVEKQLSETLPENATVH